MTATTYTTTTT